MGYRIIECVRSNGESPYRVWLEKLSIDIKARIQVRIFRFQIGNFGDRKSVGKGAYEARFTIGPGCRVYFARDGLQIVLLLTGATNRRRKRTLDWLKSIGMII